MAEKGIVYRLGWFLYWAGCIVAGLLALFLLLLIASQWQDEGSEAFMWGIFLPFAIVIWLIGRGIRYVLAGD